jgi:5-methylthioadenosine/S-adenosylhomocysteine deaminase
MMQVDVLLTGGLVLTMNEKFDAYEDGAVAIQGDSIVEVGKTAELTQQYTARQTIDCTDKIIMPGLVNAHTHVPMTLLRGMADDLRLEVWLMGYVLPTEQNFVNEDFCRMGTLLACAEMIRAGTTLFADMYYHEKVIAAATAQAGIRGVCGQSVLMFPTPDSDSWQDTMKYIEEFILEYKDHPLIVPAVAPHAPYTCTDEILEACAKMALKYDVPLHIHIAETRFEVERSLEEHDMTVLRRVSYTSVLDTKCICAHCVHIDNHEIKLAARKKVGIAHNPSSNLKLASGLAPVTEMLRQGVKVGIGTDGPASNNDLDMLQETHLASLIAKVQTGDPTALPARDALLMATRLGAAALHMDHLTGSLEVGKRADLLVMDSDGLHATPRFTHDINAVYGRIVYASKSTDIRHVMCNGAWVMWERELTTLDENQIRTDAQEMADEIDSFVRSLATDTFNKLVAIGGVEREEGFELQVKARVEGREEVDRLLNHPAVEILYARRYAQYDTYFVFTGENAARIRYREDDIKDENGVTLEVRSRLTYISPARERVFGDAVLLSRSRFFAPATYPLRFYREYFEPPQETEVQKRRLRWRIRYKGVEFYVNYDQMIRPQAGKTYLEIKSTTWSREDAESKADLLLEILSEVLKVEPDAIERREYVDVAMT